MKWNLAALARLGFICGLVLITVLSVVPQPAPTSAEGIDKIEHAIAYFTVGVAGMIGLRHRFSLLQITVAMVIYGCVMEGVQYFLPSRVAAFADIAANTIGLIVALIVVGILAYRGYLGPALNRTNG